MKKSLLYGFFFPWIYLQANCQADTIPIFKYTEAMIPMRDGVKLFTVVRLPMDSSQKWPIFFVRTPYGAAQAVLPKDSIIRGRVRPSLYVINVTQDSRGRNRSEGKKELHPPITHAKEKGTVDESTDTWDTIDWLIRNVRGNNGRVGLYGSSYPGWLSLVGAIDPHPALKAVLEHACMADLFLGDDFHHNGAFRLSYGFEYPYMMQFDSNYKFPGYDLYDWYLNLGPLKNVNEKYFHRKLTAWNDFADHPNYDSFWQKNSPLNYMPYPQLPIIHVGGYYDSDDLNGPQLMYQHLEKKDSFNRNYLLLGPWNHAPWMAKEDPGGKFVFRPIPADDSSQKLRARWRDYWLFGTGDGKFPEATCFQTGSNEWKSYDKWPPKNSTIKKLYAWPNNSCSLEKPVSENGSVSFVSDPAKPIPYRKLPIEATPGGGWYDWLVEDQRFVSSRPDVVSFTSDSLNEDLVVTGKIVAHLFASSTGTDADWVVKLIDVYPDIYKSNLLMSQYQFPVAMEVFRGRFRKSFSNPSPLVPNKPEEFVIDLHDINHVFKKGHRLMIQVQSTWFPVIDRNPQKYVPNIFEAKESDFIKATHTIHFSVKYPTHIELPVMK
jgi:uncharacterized protein